MLLRAFPTTFVYTNLSVGRIVITLPQWDETRHTEPHVSVHDNTSQQLEIALHRIGPESWALVGALELTTTYTLRVDHDWYFTVFADFSLGEDSIDTFGNEIHSHPSTRTLGDSTIMTLAGCSRAVDGNLHVRPYPASRLRLLFRTMRGRVVPPTPYMATWTWSPTGRERTGQTVSVPSASDPVAADGRFRVHLPPGTYYLRAARSIVTRTQHEYNSQIALGPEVRVVVRETGAADIQLELR